VPLVCNFITRTQLSPRFQQLRWDLLTRSFSSFSIHRTKSRGWVGSTCALFSRSPELTPRSRNRLSWVFSFLQFTRKNAGIVSQNTSRPLSLTSYPVHYTLLPAVRATQSVATETASEIPEAWFNNRTSSGKNLRFLHYLEYLTAYRETSRHLAYVCN
jgi:hypothetical protein